MSRTKRKQINNGQLLTANIFSRVLYKTAFSNRKGNQFVLSMDLLKEDVKKDLLAITTLRLEQTYTKLLGQPGSTSFMRKKGKLIWFHCSSVGEFLPSNEQYQAKKIL